MKWIDKPTVYAKFMTDRCALAFKPKGRRGWFGIFLDFGEEDCTLYPGPGKKKTKSRGARENKAEVVEWVESQVQRERRP
jgi:hypothetical protein